MIDNCLDPPEIYVPKIINMTDNRSLVDWQPPIIYDNSNGTVNITQNILPGYLNVGIHTIEYVAVDSSGNKNTCILNVTVKALKCNVLPSPANGESLCARNDTHTWCDVTCDFGYSMYQSDEEISDSLKLYCDNNNPQWQYDPLPDCTKVELPDSIEQVISITLEDNMNLCKNDSESKEKLMSQIRQQLCEDNENCEVLSEIEKCDEIIENRNKNQIDDDVSQRNFYNVVKRDTNYVNYGKPKSSANVKIRVYTKYSKGYWNQSASRNDNLQRTQEDYRSGRTNDRLKTQLNKLQIEVKHINVHEITLCKNGAIFKRNICGNCCTNFHYFYYFIK